MQLNCKNMNPITGILFDRLLFIVHVRVVKATIVFSSPDRKCLANYCQWKPSLVTMLIEWPL